MEFQFSQRPVLGDLAAFPPSISQVPGKYLGFSMTKINEKDEECGGSWTLGTGFDTTKRLFDQKRGRKCLDTSLRSQQRLIESLGAICYPARCLHGNGDNGTPTPKTLPELCLSRESGQGS